MMSTTAVDAPVLRDAEVSTSTQLRLTSQLRAIPLSFWMVGVAFGIAVKALFEGRINGWTQSDPLSSLFGGMALELWTPITVAAALAPLVALVRFRIGFLLAACSLIPMTVAISGGTPSLQLSSYVAFLGVAVCGFWRRARWSWIAAMFAMIVPVVVAFSFGAVNLVLAGNVISSESWPPGQAAAVCAVYLVPVLVGVALAWLMRWSAMRRGLERRQLAVEQAQVRNEAVAVDERARLARDLHDIVAHRISLIAVRAETAPYLHPDLDHTSQGILSDIATDARTALEEMRGVLGVLHRSTDVGVRTPQPSAAGIADLIEETRAAGTPVEVLGEMPPLPETLGSVAFRVLQEALTNARRHSSGPPVVVRFGRHDGSATMMVSNPSGGQGAPPGRGLTGMRERLHLVGGSLHTEDAGGVFTLIASLPLETSPLEGGGHRAQ